MTICDSCERNVATEQITLSGPDGDTVFFVCQGCRPEGDIIHRVSLIGDLDSELEAMLA